jgi:DNA-binding CsgD family transcriptional regulator
MGGGCTGLKRGWIHEDVRAALALAAFFGWLLSFPMFGRLLMETAGPAGPILGLVFVIGHGLGLLVLHKLPPRTASDRRLNLAAGGVIGVLTLAYVPLPRLWGLDLVVMVLLGLVSAYLVLAWASWFTGTEAPLQVLVIAMVGANLLNTVVKLPAALPLPLAYVLVSALALAGVFSFVSRAEPERHIEVAPDNAPILTSVVRGLAAFAVATYFVGGIWYRVIIVPTFLGPGWEASLSTLLYAIAVLLVAYLARDGQPGNLALFCLSALGIGLLIAATDPRTPATTLAYHVALSTGLAAGDLFYWYALWRVAKYFGGRRTFGMGLGFSLVLMALAVIIVKVGGPVYTRPLPLLRAAIGMIFLMIPLVFRHPLQLVDSLRDSQPAPSPTLPPGLTVMEGKVYAMLIQGCTDMEMAERLFISKHTVKFHVRNILRKAGAANRKQLLLRQSALERRP